MDELRSADERSDRGGWRGWSETALLASAMAIAAEVV